MEERQFLRKGLYPKEKESLTFDSVRFLERERGSVCKANRRREGEPFAKGAPSLLIITYQSK
jgi:hypothetical protein